MENRSVKIIENVKTKGLFVLTQEIAELPQEIKNFAPCCVLVLQLVSDCADISLLTKAYEVAKLENELSPDRTADIFKAVEYIYNRQSELLSD
jgi:hypothetical protein